MGAPAGELRASEGVRARGRKRRRASVRAKVKLSILGGRIVSARCRPSLALVDVPRATGRVAMPQYRKLLTACLRSVVPEAFLSSTSTSIQEDSGTKTEVSHDEGPVSAFHRGLIFRPRKNPQVKESPNSRAPRGPRLLRGIPRFSCQDLPRRLYFFGLARHCTRSTGSPEGASFAATMSSGAQLLQRHLLRGARHRLPQSSIWSFLQDVLSGIGGLKVLTPAS